MLWLPSSSTDDSFKFTSDLMGYSKKQHFTVGKTFCRAVTDAAAIMFHACVLPFTWTLSAMQLLRSEFLCEELNDLCAKSQDWKCPGNTIEAMYSKTSSEAFYDSIIL